MFAALGRDGSAGIGWRGSIGGTALVANPQRAEPTFASLVIGEDREALATVADIGCTGCRSGRCATSAASGPTASRRPA